MQRWSFGDSLDQRYLRFESLACEPSFSLYNVRNEGGVEATNTWHRNNCL